MVGVDDDDRSGNQSICTRPEFAVIKYHWYPRFSGDKPIDAFRTILEDAGLVASEVTLFVGELRATMRLLAQGKLRPLHEIKGPMRAETRLRIFELRFSHLCRGPSGGQREVHVRMYHVEPSALQSTTSGSVVIGLNMHGKDITADDVVDEQDDAIRHAGRRFFDGRSDHWGLPAHGRST